MSDLGMCSLLYLNLDVLIWTRNREDKCYHEDEYRDGRENKNESESEKDASTGQVACAR
jgi:hypothetical protein